MGGQISTSRLIDMNIFKLKKYQNRIRMERSTEAKNG